MDCDVYSIWLNKLHLLNHANSHNDCDVYTIWFIVIAPREKTKKCDNSCLNSLPKCSFVQHVPLILFI